ncbi:MAG: choice-of-anchor Q domain-containing protein, partial [Planctomycetota bacterium]
MRNVKNLALFVLIPVLVSTVAVADIHYVNPGESIQAAIDVAVSGVDEIEVAPGTYSEAIDFIGKAIRLYSSGGPDVTTIDGTGHYHVVQCISGEDNGTILEGFTITGGNAMGSGFDGYGGGMFNDYSSPTVTNCTFTGNSADYGGGMGGWSTSSPTVTNCTFSGNIAIDGGGMYNHQYSSPTVTDCTFSDNTASNGGGMRNYYSSPTVTDCTFSGNTANKVGGGMCNAESNNSTVTDCTFRGNIAIWGGGMFNWDNSSLTVTNCSFSDNAADYGGGMYNGDESSSTVTNCTFTGNIAIDGGGMYNDTSSPTLANCILWGDSPDEIFEDSSSTTVTYSDVQGGTGETWFGVGCIDTDPMFADAEGRLLAFSPCLDAGNDAAVPPGVTTDLDGNPRIQGVCVDMGAFESDLNYMDPGWVFMIPDAPDFGYSLNEADLLYFYSIDFVQSLNIATGGWSIYRPIGWVYIEWPFYYELDTDTLMFALPP